MTGGQLALLASARRATLATIGPDGRPRLVPCCYAPGTDDGMLVIDTPIDTKPKATIDPLRLARVRDIMRDPRVTLLVDHWDEDWSRLGWLRMDGVARLMMPGVGVGVGGEATHRAAAIDALRARYPQYRDQPLERLPIIRVAAVRVTGWSADHR